MVKICKYVYKAVDTELICIWDCGKNVSLSLQAQAIHKTRFLNLLYNSFDQNFRSQNSLFDRVRGKLYLL